MKEEEEIALLGKAINGLEEVVSHGNVWEWTASKW